MSCDSESVCVPVKSGSIAKGTWPLLISNMYLDPVSGCALASVSPAQQTEGFDIGGGGLNVTAGAKHGCRETYRFQQRAGTDYRML